MTNGQSATASVTPSGAFSVDNPDTTEHRKLKLTLQQELFVFSSLMLITCFFLPWQGNETPWDMLVSLFPRATSLFWITLLVLLCVTPFSVLTQRARPRLGIAVTITIGLALLFFAGFGTAAYGAQLTKIFTFALLLLSATQELRKAGDLAMRRLNSRAADVLTHWGTVVPGVHFSAQDLYTKIEETIRDRKWPGVEFLRVVHSEAGLFSHKREYLRIVRQRQVFDFCASTFGKDYFFSLREGEITARLTLANNIIFFIILAICFIWAVSIFGKMFGTLSFAIGLVIAVLLLLNVLRMGLTRFDGILLRTPIIGPIYETWFRRSTTYFQHDARMVFLKFMDDLLKAYVDEETSEKGVTLLSSFEHQPILDGLYKTSTRKLNGGNAREHGTDR